MNTSPRIIVIHSHIFKNAGSTFDWALKRCFGEAFLDHRDNVSMRKGAGYLGRFLQQNPHLKAVSSHHVRLPLPELESVRLIPAFFLRHPIERSYSVYAFERRQPEDTPGGRIAKQLSFRDYIHWRMQPKVGATLRDFQTRVCSIRVGPRKITVGESELNEATRTLEETPLVGAVDLFDQSMLLFEVALGEHFPGIDLAYVLQNTGTSWDQTESGPIRRILRSIQCRSAARPALSDTPTRTADRVQWVLDRLGSEIGELLLQNNERDLELYRRAGRLVLMRFNELEESFERLAQFKERCRRLVTVPAEGLVRTA